ncbi:MAG TPA: cytochrome C oxidase Cbb3 [Methylovirgula sp.]|nr:cytochrome C oxidase Cbb3 [Methylovirgula sp.]
MMRWIVSLLVPVAVILAAARLIHIEYAPVPSRDELANPQQAALDEAYDVLGRAISPQEAQSLQKSAAGRALLSPEAGAVPVNPDLVRLGRDSFYRETYGNEYFITDVLGLLNGGLSVFEVVKATALLAGRGTDDLKIRLARDMVIGDRLIEKGTLISTGIGVPKGGVFPLGTRVIYDRGTIRIGITCALCHSAVNENGKVIEGAPNRKLNAGFLLALASNPNAYFMHTGVQSMAPFETDPARVVTTSAGTHERLPDPQKLRQAVTRMLASWPPGNFDSSPDLINNPTAIPSSFTASGWPYGWSGHALIGPFHGLSALNNNVHALNSDTTAQYRAAPQLFGLDPEVYLGIILQDAANPVFRFDPQRGGKPSAVLEAADPTPGTPGLNRFAVLPTYPRANYMTANSLIASNPDETVMHSINAIAAFENTLGPPPAHVQAAAIAAGRAVFERAHCASCHSGPALTNNRVLPVEAIGTEPTRAKSFARTQANIASPNMFAPDTPTDHTQGAKLIAIPMDQDTASQAKLAWGQSGNGGYKVANLIGLAWSAPYLHDGGVAVGKDTERDLGVAGTSLEGRAADPKNSLLALIDRRLRARVIAANAASPEAQLSHISGAGHEFWVDPQAGFSAADQQALIAYLVSIDRLSTDAQ